MGADLQSYRTGVTLVVVAGLLWSLMALGIRLIEGQNTWAILIWRSLGMVPVLLCFIIFSARSPGAVFRLTPPIGIGAVALAFCFAFAIFAFQRTSAANAVFPLAVTPLISAVLAWILLGEPIRRATWFAIAIAAVGVFVMVAEGLSAGDAIGNLAALAAACCFAVFTVCLRWGGAADSLPGTFWGAVCAAVLGFVAATAQGLPVMMPARDTAIALAIGIVLLGVGLALFARGSRSVPAADLSLLTLIEVLLAPVWVWLVLDQTSSGMTLVGGAIVLAAIAFNAVSGLRAGRALSA